MKNVPIAVKIPCILDMVIGGLLIFVGVAAFAAGASLNIYERIIMMVALINSMAAYKCMNGNNLARHILIWLKALAIAFIPIMFFIALLWVYLLMRHNSSKKFFSSFKDIQTEDIANASSIVMKPWQKGVAVVAVSTLIIVVYLHLQNSPEIKIGKKIDKTMANMEIVNSFIKNYVKENNKLPSSQEQIKELNDPNKHKVSLDEWGNGIIYIYDNNNAYQLRSFGEDQVESEDDIVIKSKLK